jgi:hypothetical protein
LIARSEGARRTAVSGFDTREGKRGKIIFKYLVLSFEAIPGSSLLEIHKKRRRQEESRCFALEPSPLLLFCETLCRQAYWGCS